MTMAVVWRLEEERAKGMTWETAYGKEHGKEQAAHLYLVEVQILLNLPNYQLPNNNQEEAEGGRERGH